MITDWREVLADDSIDVVDITPHPRDRLPIIEAALRVGKHVLSQKPFVLDLADGERLADLAEANGVKRAINQNGRRAPHHAWMRAAVRAGLATLVFADATEHGPRDTTFIAFTSGSLESIGPDLGAQGISLTTANGRASPDLEENWFNDCFRGAMGELLCAIEEDREPDNGARANLRSLAICFAAVRSARTGREVSVGDAASLG